MSSGLYEIENLQLSIGDLHAIRGVDLSLQRGRCSALVGESGSGKSLTGLSLLGLQPAAATMSAGRMCFDGIDVAGIDEQRWRGLRGNRLAMIFQNPMTALNPTMRIGAQIAETLRLHRGMTATAARAKALALLERMSVPRPDAALKRYPFEMSGGMLQRIMIAQAVACEPDLMIADEPTTALDVTVQAEVLALLAELQRESGMALLLITHDLGVVARLADDVSVMYAGEIVESGGVNDVFYRAAHPYTRALQRSMPSLLASDVQLQSIAGVPPDLRRKLSHCSFMERCGQAMTVCNQSPPLLDAADHQRSRCWLSHTDCPQPLREAWHRG